MALRAQPQGAQGSTSRSTSHDVEATGAEVNKGCARQSVYLSSTMRDALVAPVKRTQLGATHVSVPSAYQNPAPGATFGLQRMGYTLWTPSRMMLRAPSS